MTEMWQASNLNESDLQALLEGRSDMTDTKIAILMLRSGQPVANLLAKDMLEKTGNILYN